MKLKIFLIINLIFQIQSNAFAHSDVINSGWFHPLSGMDHLLAMVSVGAWSAIIGGRAIYAVPSFFVLLMILGSFFGLIQFDIKYTEEFIITSVIFLGGAIFVKNNIYVFVASLFVGVFGFFHGYAHGHEIPVVDDVALYVFGFIFTTITLHIIGVFYGKFWLKSKKGVLILKTSGLLVFFSGIYLALTK